MTQEQKDFKQEKERVLYIIQDLSKVSLCAAYGALQQLKKKEEIMNKKIKKLSKMRVFLSKVILIS
jgi:ERCC4-type nuclease